MTHYYSLALLMVTLLFAQSETPKAPAPAYLRIDLIRDSDQLTINGYPASARLSELSSIVEPFQVPEIRNTRPRFSWQIEQSGKNIQQKAYQILVAADREKCLAFEPDMWDSGVINSFASSSIPYNGKALQPDSVYFWTVRTLCEQWSPFAEPMGFKMAAEPANETSTYPLQKTKVSPQSIRQRAVDTLFVDFGRAAFAQLEMTLESDQSDTLTLALGEVADAGRIDQQPGGSRRYREIPLPLMPGLHTYFIKIPPDERNTRDRAIKMPPEIGEVMPFRYLEIWGYEKPLKKNDLSQIMVHYPFDDNQSSFWSSNKVLNDVWDLCKYSIKATSFCGIYVDGDRERIPYEADAYINQLSHYGVDAEYTMARASHEYMITHPTWPTEWILHSVLMAYEDALYSGDLRSAETYYSDLHAKTLLGLAREDGLISSQTGRVTPDLLASIHFGGKLRDIVDWPHTGILGLEEGKGGETDGFVFKPYNTVVNAFHYGALQAMADIAGWLGKDQDQTFYLDASHKVKKAFNQAFFDQKTRTFTDGIGTDHRSLHANFFALRFGLVPKEHIPSVVDFIKERGMRCSVYGAQHLLDALYTAGEAHYAFDLMTAMHDRSWANMIYGLGSTITTEAWDNKYKPNQDWNHAWGAAPANIIPRRLVGVRPLQPGFDSMIIHPQPGPLQHCKAQIPSIKGPIFVQWHHTSNESVLHIETPANTRSRIILPHWGQKIDRIWMDDRPVDFKVTEQGLDLGTVGSGRREYKMSYSPGFSTKATR